MALAERGIEKLYSHQAQAFELARSGKNVVVVTPDGLRKTLCYNLPVLQTIVENPDARALYLYPTKALTYDQLDDLMRWANGLSGDGGIGVYSYDGDTPQDARSAVRSRGHIVLSNPDMLHKGILPHHTKWTRLFENLRVHRRRRTAHVSRRLWKSSSRISSGGWRASASFTEASRNSSALRRRLRTRRSLPKTSPASRSSSFDESGAGEGEKHVFFYNPPVVNRQLGIRRSYVKKPSISLLLS